MRSGDAEKEGQGIDGTVILATGAGQSVCRAIAKLVPPAFSFQELRIDDLSPCNQTTTPIRPSP